MDGWRDCRGPLSVPGHGAPERAADCVPDVSLHVPPRGCGQQKQVAPGCDDESGGMAG